MKNLRFKRISTASVYKLNKWMIWKHLRELFLNFLIFKNFYENVSSHVCIICCLMIIWKKRWTFIIYKSIFQIKFKINYINKSFILLAFLKDISKISFSKIFSLKRKNFCIIYSWKFFMPFCYKFFISLRQWSNKLIVKINYVIHHIVSNSTKISVILKFFNYFFNNKCETKFK